MLIKNNGSIKNTHTIKQSIMNIIENRNTEKHKVLGKKNHPNRSDLMLEGGEEKW